MTKFEFLQMYYQFCMLAGVIPSQYEDGGYWDGDVPYVFGEYADLSSATAQTLEEIRRSFNA